MKSFAELKAASKEERREMIRNFTHHPITKITGAIVISAGTKIATNLLVDKVEEKLDARKNKEIEA